MKTLSFRDPKGFVYVDAKYVFRFVDYTEQDFIKFIYEDLLKIKKRINGGKIVNSKMISSDSLRDLLDHNEYEFVSQRIENREMIVVEHEKVPFVSYPYEWPPEMLFAAGSLTIEIALASLEYGYIIKDATPYNVLFKGCCPIFVDILSFEKRQNGYYTWIAYAQFIRMFYLPLMANKYFNFPTADALINHRDGLEPEYVYNMCGFMQKILPPFLTKVSFPCWLNKGISLETNKTMYQVKVMKNDEKAEYVYASLLKELKKDLLSLKPQERKSVWSEYSAANHNNYTADQINVKKNVVKRILDKLQVKNVLDIGCNTGIYSLLAAQCGANVVAIDSDPVVIGDLWQTAYDHNLNILPLVVNIARPTPAMGWCNNECFSFIERAREHFDMVFMLAVIHHLLVSERIRLDDILELAAGLTTKYCVVEYVDPADIMFQNITRGRGNLYEYLNEAYFAERCKRKFEILDIIPITDTRQFFVMKRR